MRIGIDATCWWSQRGFGRFTRGLLPALFEASADHQFVLFTDQPPVAEMLKPGVDVVQVMSPRPSQKPPLPGAIERRAMSGLSPGHYRTRHLM